MSNHRLVLGNYRFTTQKEYDDAVQDQLMIDTIGKQYDLHDCVQLASLYRDIQSGKYVFISKLGRDFDDSIYEKYHTILKSGVTSSKKENGQSRKQVSLDDFDSDMQQRIKAEWKKMERKRRLIIASCMGVAFISFLFFSLQYREDQLAREKMQDLASIKDTVPFQESASTFQISVHLLPEEEPVVLEVLDSYKNLYNLNKSLIGWLKIDDTIIDYPVMQSTDNEFFLTHNFDMELDRRGSLFLDYRNDYIRNNDNLIIYGHHLRSGNMFGTLDRYKDQEFYENHKFIQFDTIYEQRIYEVMYVFRSRVFTKEDITFKYYDFIDASSAAEFDSYMNEMQKLSFYETGVTAKLGDELLTLSTCDTIEVNGRFVVVAKRVYP